MRRLGTLCLATAVLAGCASVDPSAPDPLTVTATVELVGDSVAVTNRIHNASGHSAEVDLSPCVAGFNAYSSSDRRGTPLWEFAPWKGPCPAILVRRFILPNGTIEYRVTAPIPSNIRSGRLYFTSIIRTIPPSGVTVPAGVLEL